MRRVPLTSMAIVGLLAGCSSVPDAAEAPDTVVTHTMQLVQCGEPDEGLRLITSRRQWQQLPLVRIRPALGETTLPDNQWRLQISLGQKPTLGYGISLQDAELRDDTLVLRVLTQQPAPGVAVAQMISTPCLVVNIPKDGWQQLQVEGLEPQPSRCRIPEGVSFLPQGRSELLSYGAAAGFVRGRFLLTGNPVPGPYRPAKGRLRCPPAVRA